MDRSFVTETAEVFGKTSIPITHNQEFFVDLRSLSVPDLTEDDVENMEVLLEQAARLAQVYSSYASALQTLLSLKEVMPMSFQSEEPRNRHEEESDRLYHASVYLEVAARRQAIIEARADIEADIGFPSFPKLP